jgi:2-dehydropantoate 2-reductase
MRVVIFGTGAMACLFGARLSAVTEVTLVGTWAEAIYSIRDRGIVVEGHDGTRTARVDARFLDETPVRGDLALVLVKTWQTERVAAVLDRYLSHSGLAVSLQNGLGNVEILGPRSCAGSTGMGATTLAPAHIRIGGEGQTLAAVPSEVIGLLRRAGFDALGCSKEESESLLWGKLCVSCGINAPTGLLQAENGKLLEMPGARALMETAATECALVAGAKGIPLPYEDPVARVREVAGRTARNRSSMYQDLLRFAPTECDAIYGSVVREARCQGVDVPVNRILWVLIQALVKRNEDRMADENCE